MFRSPEWIFERIRRDRRLNPTVSQRTLAQWYGASRKTVVKVLKHAVLPVRKPPSEPNGFIDGCRRDTRAPVKRSEASGMEGHGCGGR